MRGQGTGYSFAWFDTVTDTFLNYVKSFDTLLDKANAMCNKYEIMHDDIFVKTTPEGGIVLDRVKYVYKDNSGAD